MKIKCDECIKEIKPIMEENQKKIEKAIDEGLQIIKDFGLGCESIIGED